MPGAMPFGLKIAVIKREFRKKMDEKAAAMGLTSVQLRVLGTISRLEAAGHGEIHQKDLEEIERVTHPAMTRLLQRLENKGFVRCVPSKQDRRFKAIACTDQSSEIYKLILEHDGEVFQDLCRNFTQEQQDELLRLTDLILQGVDSL